MPMTMRASLAGYDCLTDGTIDHYSIYADSDNVLIKEFSRGTINITHGALGTITHSLGIIPLSYVYVNSSGTQGFLSGNDANSAFPATYSLGTSNLIITNNFFSGTQTFNYFIFYDQGTAL